MIAKIVPRGAAGTAGTRAGADRLMAYLLGEGDKDRAAETGAAPELVPSESGGPAGDAERSRGAREAGLPPEQRPAVASHTGAPPSAGNRHVQPRVVAAWDPLIERSWGQVCASVDWADEASAWAAMRKLASGFSASVAGALPLDRGGADRDLVWHTIMAAHPDDGELSDEQWRAVAHRLMKETGLDDGKLPPVRWVAVRHGANEAGADHIHVMAVLVREDGSRPRLHNDAFAAQRAARWAEAEFGLRKGLGRTSASDPRQGRGRADKPAARGEQAAAEKAGPPYPRPQGMGDDLWAWLCREGTSAAWTRRGVARGAVLSAAARAVSMEHLVQLVEEQGYRVTLRESVREPGTVTGWSITAPSAGPRGKPKSYSGGALGRDCTWGALRQHVEVKNRHLSPARGTVVAAEEDAMLSRERMAAAGWGPEFIARVIEADQALAAGDRSVAYWLRDAVWQVAWDLEGSKGKHGVWSDAAYLYSVAAEGGVPQPPQEMIDALAAVRVQIEDVWARKQAFGSRIAAREAGRDQRDTEVAAAQGDWRRAQAAVDRAVARIPFANPYAPGHRTVAGIALLAKAEATGLQERANELARRSREVVRVATEAARASRAAAEADGRELDALNEWLERAAAYERHAERAVQRHAAAAAAWRTAMGELLIDARAGGDDLAAARIAAIDVRYAGAPAAGDAAPAGSAAR